MNLPRRQEMLTSLPNWASEFVPAMSQGKGKYDSKSTWKESVPILRPTEEKH